jgi:hypothetical protein
VGEVVLVFASSCRSRLEIAKRRLFVRARLLIATFALSLAKACMG